MSDKKSVEMAQLLDFVISISQITCNSCNKMEEVDNSCEIDILDGIEYFYDQGWRNKKGVCLCKNCQNGR